MKKLGLFVTPIKVDSSISTYNDYLDFLVEAEEKGYPSFQKTGQEGSQNASSQAGSESDGGQVKAHRKSLFTKCGRPSRF